MVDGPETPLNPTDTDETLLQQAFDAHRRADFAEADRLYRAVVAIKPDEARALANLGGLSLQHGDAVQALDWLDKAIAARPGFVAALSNRAGALRSLGRRAEALEAVRQALASEPAHPDALNTEGLLLVELGRPLEALAALDKAVKLAPGQPFVWNNHGLALAALSRPEEALASFDQALALAPDYNEAQSNRAAALRALGRLDEALTACDQLLAAQPGHIDARVNRACVLRDLGRPQEALNALEQTCAIAPGHVEAHWTLALELLAGGRWDEGWPLFEWRWRRPEFQPLAGRFEAPPWLGRSPIAGRTLLLHYEQGLGDSLLMLRYIAPLAEQGARVILAVQPAILPLVRGLPGLAQAISDGDPAPPFDLHCPLMSLPLAFGARPDRVSWNGPYLSAPPDAAARWGARLAALPRPRIGLAWSGNPRNQIDRARSLSLEALQPVLDAGAAVVSLQKDYRPGDRERLAALGVTDVSDELVDFAETAALIGQLDLVVSIDTSVAHLAGAMGKPVLLLAPFTPDFRWIDDGQRAIWYPAVRVLRQPVRGDWPSSIRRAAEAVAALAQPG